MSHVDNQPGANGSKRRARRKAAKAALGATEPFASTNQYDSADVLRQLKLDLERAKSEGDFKQAHLLRQRVWLAQDAAAGVKSDITRQGLKNILNTVMADEPKEPDMQGTVAVDDGTIKENQERANQASISAKIDFLEKKLRKLQKKKAQIEKLKERLKVGESLENTQITKINSEKELDDQIDDVEEELYRVTRS